MSFENILYSKEDGVAKIVLNHPDSLNPLSVATSGEIAAALADAGNDEAVRAVVITGAGRAFSAGADVKSLAQGRTANGMRDRIHSSSGHFLEQLVNLEKPVIAMVNGYAVGAGCNLALACDIVIASNEAKFCQSQTRVGLIPDFGGLYHLPRLVGIHKAKELIFTGDMIDAVEAERIGLINKAVPADELEATVMALAKRLAKGPTRAMGIAKTLLHRSLAVDLPSAIELEAMGQGLCVETEDHKEGVKAFVEKRQSQFKGR